MTTVEKARLLAELFPDHMPDIVRFIEQQVLDFERDGEDPFSRWASLFDSPEFWTDLCRTIRKIILRYGDRLAIRPELFADQLFDGHNSLLTTTCLAIYADNRTCDPKVRQAINLLFGVRSTQTGSIETGE